MNGSTVAEVSKKLNIPADTLRYYDRINLVSPKRGENRYRVYEEEDISRLMYTEVLKYAGFTLSEIQTIFNVSCDNFKKCRETSTKMLQDKKKEIEEKIFYLKEIIKIADITIDVFESIEEKGFSVLDEWCFDIYNQINSKKGDNSNV